jgi:nucleoid-associated protein YgaU
MNRLALTATIGAVLVAAILGLIYAVSKQDDDAPEPTTQSQSATPPVASTAEPAPTQNTAETQPATDTATPAPAEPTQNQQQTQTQPQAPSQPTQNATTTQPAQQTQAPAAAPSADNTQATAAAPSPSPTTNTQAASAAPATNAPPTPPEVKPSFDVVRVNPNGDAVVAGRAQPGAKITLLDNGHPVGSATADDRGEWVLLPDSAVDPGQHKFSLQAMEDDGKSQESEKEVIVVVPKPAEDIAGQPVTKPSGALALEVPKQGDGPTQLLNAPSSASNPPVAEPASTTSEAAAASPPPPPLSLDTIDYTQDGRAMLSGHTLPGSDLIIYLDNASLGAAKADQNGRWTFVPEAKSPIGDHEVRVDLVDGAGKVQSRVKVPFAQPDFTQVKLTDDTVIVQPGNSLWRIARKTYGEGLQYTVIYEANKDHIGDPNLIYPGQIFNLPKKSGG